MEGKVTLLETLGMVKDLLEGNYWKALYETSDSLIFHSKTKSNNKHSSKKTQVFTNTLKSGNVTHPYKIIRKTDILTKEWTYSEQSGRSNEGKESKEVVPEKICWKMEVKGSKVEVIAGSRMSSNAKDEKGLHSKDVFDINRNKQKTNESDKDIESLLDSFDGISKLNSGPDTMGLHIKDCHSSDGEDFHQEIIPISMSGESSLSVQDWVNHIPSEGKMERECDYNLKEGNEDLGNQSVVFEDGTECSAKLKRETSIQSNSSLDSILDSRRPDPVEIFLNLGFGGVPGVDMENCRIPRRFLVPSKCKGGDWNEFLRRELLQAQNFECSSLGFRGLSGPSYRRPSAIVANIMEKLRERASPQPHPRSRFSSVARRVLNEKSVLNEFQSVLSPDSRKFLQNQGKKSPEVPRRRIIFGQKSFAFAHDGEFVEVEPDVDRRLETGKESAEAAAAKSSNGEAEESSIFTNSEILLKLRRSSLQKQKKVEEDVEDIFYVVGNDNPGSRHPDGGSYSESSKTGKIPRRFLSSSNLKNLEAENVSEAMRLEVEKEIKALSEKVKNVSSQDLPSVLKQVKELCSRLENSSDPSTEL